MPPPTTCRPSRFARPVGPTSRPLAPRWRPPKRSPAIARRPSSSHLDAELARCGAEEEQAAADVASAEADVTLANGPAFDAAVASAAEAEAALARSTVREQAARSALAEVDAEAGIDAVRRPAAERLAAAERAVTEAAAAEQATAAALAEVDATYSSATAAEAEALAAAEQIDRAKLVEDIDWELMGRLAALRSVGLAGSVPLVLDDPFAVLDDDELTTVLDRVARLAGAVQVILVTDREAAVAWAAQIGSERALVHADRGGS